jgi:hypothetical protein
MITYLPIPVSIFLPKNQSALPMRRSGLKETNDKRINMCRNEPDFRTTYYAY